MQRRFLRGPTTESPLLPPRSQHPLSNWGPDLMCGSSPRVATGSAAAPSAVDLLGWDTGIRVNPLKAMI